MSMRAICLSSSPARWLGEPVPAEAQAYLPGVLRIRLISSCRFWAGTALLTAIVKAVRLTRVTGAKSRAGSKRAVPDDASRDINGLANYINQSIGSLANVEATVKDGKLVLTNAVGYGGRDLKIGTMDADGKLVPTGELEEPLVGDPAGELDASAEAELRRDLAALEARS